MKTYFFTIDKEYANKYKIDSDFIGKNVVLYDNQIYHLEKHKTEFISEESYIEARNNIKIILEEPEFIRKDDKNNSLLFIKTLTDHTLVAVRISNKKELKVRTLYPITLAKKNKLKSRT